MPETERVLSRDLTPGTRVQWMGRHNAYRPAVAVLERRKRPSDDHHGLPYMPGWWIEGGGGLADVAIDDADSQWEILP